MAVHDLLEYKKVDYLEKLFARVKREKLFAKVSKFIVDTFEADVGYVGLHRLDFWRFKEYGRWAKEGVDLQVKEEEAHLPAWALIIVRYAFERKKSIYSDCPQWDNRISPGGAFDLAATGFFEAMASPIIVHGKSEGVVYAQYQKRQDYSIDKNDRLDFLDTMAKALGNILSDERGTCSRQ